MVDDQLTNDELGVIVSRLAEVRDGHYVHIGDSL